MLAGDYSAVSFALDGVRKDARLMVEAAESERECPATCCGPCLGVYDRASEQGHGDEDLRRSAAVEG